MHDTAPPDRAAAATPRSRRSAGTGDGPQPTAGSRGHDGPPGRPRLWGAVLLAALAAPPAWAQAGAPLDGTADSAPDGASVTRTGPASPALSPEAAPALPAAGSALTWSGYGTLGYNRSNRDFIYLREIDRQGTLKRDSVLGLQADLRIDPHWSATAQLRLGPREDSDHGVEVRPAWAFLAWRPDDDWLLRAGRMRVPLYLYSESIDVGQTQDMARLPVEAYGIAPTNDFNGLYLTRYWSNDRGELSLDAYAGHADSWIRFWLRDGLPGMVPSGAFHAAARTRLGGLALTWRQPGLTLHGSLIATSNRRKDGVGLPQSFPYVSLGPGIGYYVVDEALGPGVTRVDRVRNLTWSLGAEWRIDADWRLVAEHVRNRQKDTDFGIDATGDYVTLLTRAGDWTPYVSVARMRSRELGFAWFDRLTTHPLPSVVPGADAINGLQRVVAEALWPTEQQTWAVGAAWALGPSLKLKGEWGHTRIGRRSRFVDARPGSDDVRQRSLDVLTLNLNWVY
jgi:hypothetical protein